MRNLLLVITLILTLVGQGIIANHSFAMSMPQTAASMATASQHSATTTMDCCQGSDGCHCQMSADHCSSLAGCAAHCSAVSAITDFGVSVPVNQVTQRINVPLWSVQTAYSHVQTPPPNLA
ncbi:hypothetical protein L9G74_12430 [Shewanella sp. C32]|uniref:Uncharacterized protein n=1 Tax=Shewanella electrica TaxID=515560 RepID=A0ABT2FMQ2_9GAMM|nr:hypothetical protein [Shewanella electrica]MCH1925863.1 hypothetical protein [Shewanella electrica]MCS4557252.1 hypothetical protein [Shewanella electrica]